MITVTSATLSGITGRLVRITATSHRRRPDEGLIRLVGLSEHTEREVSVRVLHALRTLGADTGGLAVVVTVDPEQRRGESLDLAVAMAVLGALGKVEQGALDSTLFLGELSLDGEIRPVRGVLPQLAEASLRGFARAIVPWGNRLEAAEATGIDVRTAKTLLEAYVGIRDRGLPKPEKTPFSPEFSGELSDVRIDPRALRAIIIAATGGHRLLLIGSPGSGRTMIARRLGSIMPPMTYQEAYETTLVHSAAAMTDSGLLRSRPFRAPHFTISDLGLTGGGDPARPGEASLAHHGVLFLDELHEFRRSALEGLGRVLDQGEATVSRRGARATFPAKPLLVATANPCPCGYAWYPDDRCRCTTAQTKAYRASLIEKAALVGIEIVTVCLDYDPSVLPPSEPSEKIRESLIRARAILGPCPDQARDPARTIAALAGHGQVNPEHIAEAKALWAFLG